MSDRVQNEAKVGAFFLAAAVLVTVVFVFLGDYAGRWSSIIIVAHFRDVAGLESGADVQLSGVRVGRVIKVHLEDDAKFPGRPAQVTMAIGRDVILSEDDKFFVDQGAILGDKYVTVVKAPAVPKTRLENGAHVAGAGLAGLSGLAQETQELISDAKKTLYNIESTFAGPERKDQIDTIVQNIISTTTRADAVAADAQRFATSLASMAQQNAPRVAEMADNLKIASKTVRDTALIAQQMLANSPIPAELNRAAKNVATSTENIVKSTEDVNAITENMRVALADPQLRARMETALDNLQTASENLSVLSERAQRMLDDEEGVGTDIKQTMRNVNQATSDLADTAAHMKELLSDPQLNEDIKVTVAKTRETMEQATEVTQKASRSLDRVDSTMTGVQSAIGAIKPLETQAAMRFEAATERGLRLDFTTDLYYRMRYGDFWRVGIRDVGDAERLILQKSVPLSERDALRVGIFGGEVGIGYDRLINARTAFELEYWQPDEHIIDLRTYYRIRPGLDIVIGGNDLLNDADAFGGLRYYLWGPAAAPKDGAAPK